MKRRFTGNRVQVAFILSVASGCVEGTPSEQQSLVTSNIVEASGVNLGDLPGMVKVNTFRGQCSGMVISNNTILTAAHCICTENLVGGYVCNPDVTVSFQRNVAAPNQLPMDRIGRAVYHPSYNPSWTEQQLEHDLAVVKLEGVGPAHASSFIVANNYPATGSTVMIAGYGMWGTNCLGPSGYLHYDFEDVGSYQDGHDILVFNDRAICDGDSGGAVLEPDGTLSPKRLLAVHSALSWEVSHGYINQATTTSMHFEWIKSFMCNTTSRNRCSGNGDLCDCTGHTDVLWRHTDGTVALWGMNGQTIESESYYSVSDLGWQIKGTGDFNGDRHADMLWRHTNGQTAIWHMANGALLYALYPGGQNSGLTWTIQGVGDFDNNGRSDILWREYTGQLAIWLDGDATRDVYPSWRNQGGPVDTSWRVEGVGDFDGDARSDILWRQPSTSATAIWLMSAGSMLDEWDPGSLASSTVEAIGDFDGNRRSDILWRTYDGSLRIWFNGGQNVTRGALSDSNKMRGPSYNNALGSNLLPAPVDTAWRIQRVGDFNNDGRDDILWRHTNGSIAIWLLDGIQYLGDLYPRGPNETSPRWVENAWQVQGAMFESGF